MSHLGAAHATELGADGSPVLRLTVSGVSSSLPLRKDADGRLGLQFAEGTPSGSVQGAVIASVLPRSAARDAGLRGGDLVRTMLCTMACIMLCTMACTCARVRARVRAHICVRVAHVRGACPCAARRARPSPAACARVQVVAVGEQPVHDIAAAREAISSAARGLTLVVWRPRADAPGGEEPVAGQPRPSSTELDDEGRHALRQEWYFTADAAQGLPEGALLYEDLTVPVQR